MNARSIKKEAVRHLYDKSNIPFRTIDYDTMSKQLALPVSPKKQGEFLHFCLSYSYSLLNYSVLKHLDPQTSGAFQLWLATERKGHPVSIKRKFSKVLNSIHLDFFKLCDTKRVNHIENKNHCLSNSV